MASPWPWLAIAGLGALHGLSPANGWLFAAACGLHARDASPLRRALAPLALGHAVSVAGVAAAFAQGMPLDLRRLQGLPGALLVGVAVYRALRGAAARGDEDRLTRFLRGTRAGQAGLALWSCLMATAQGSGLMLLPAMTPPCLAVGTLRESGAAGSFALALGAVALHLAAMLCTTGALASGLRRGVARLPAARRDILLHHAGTAVCLLLGVALLAPG